MFGYVLVIFRVGRMLTDSLSKQRGRQVDLNECSPPFLLSPLTKKNRNYAGERRETLSELCRLMYLQKVRKIVPLSKDVLKTKKCHEMSELKCIERKS